MCRTAETWTVRYVIRILRAMATLAVVVAPTAAMLLAAPGAAALTPPAGTAAWLADVRHLPDPILADPVDIDRFLTSVDETTRHDLVTRYPEVVGALDGAPPELRYEANHRNGQILLYDPRGDGRVAQVFGNLATADRIAVLVPGVGNRLDTFWTGVGGRRYRAPATQAANLYQAGTGNFAVIAWLGYDTPDGVDVSAAREDLARAGAVALDRFVAGLTAVRPHATIALLGHSYGSTVVGLAAPGLPSNVTDIAVFGSPGMGVDDVAQLRTAARVWAGQSTGDWIGLVPGIRILGLGHGTKPTDPGFGARVFSTADVPDHDHYLSPGTDSLANLARIATGRP
ncbi:alpha/beta hydrolase [Kibdelosporangium lantanae]